MKAVFENVETHMGHNSFVAYSFTVPFFEFKWHYHPEYELTLITKGNGKRVVGDSHRNFSKGDLVLVGSGLPHTWSGTPLNVKKSAATVIQFSEAFISGFAALSEFSQIRELLSKAGRGLCFGSRANTELGKKIKDLPKKEGIYRISSLFEILHLLSAETYEMLSSDRYVPVKGKATENRINKICQYVQEHAVEAISIEQAAGMIHLSKSAFCKFFRRVMKTSFSDYVNEIRVANACRLLLETDHTIREIALETGFESLTYFNRVFLKKKTKTPGAFRKSLTEQKSA